MRWPALRPQKHNSGSQHSESSSTDATCVVRPEASAKSFSYVPVRKRQVEAAEQAAQHAPAQSVPQSRVKYESISQFSQKIELYRGR